MNRNLSLTIAALVAASIAAGAAPAFAQDQRPREHFRLELRGPDDGRGPGQHRNGGRDGIRGGLFALVCAADGADRLEHMLLSLSQRTDPTAAQQPLFDSLKAAAIAAQSDFAAVCEANKPVEGAAPTADMADRMATHLKIEEARLAALSDVLPAFEAFYDSLTDEQKAAIAPPPRERHQLGDKVKPGERGPDAPVEQQG